MEKKTMVIGAIVIIAIIGAYLYINGYIPQLNLPFLNSQNETGNTSLPETGQHNIEISNFAFSPSSIAIKAGDTVIWTNMDSVGHTITSDSGNELQSEAVSNGETYSHTFENAGTYLYHCSIHTSMKGEIIVE